MRGFVSRVLRREARSERAGEAGVNDRDLITFSAKDSTLRNTPHSVRAMYLKLKAAYKRMRAFAGAVRLLVQRARRGSDVHKPQPEDRIATIQKPLEFILQHCPHTRNMRNEIEEHPVYRSARIAAARGRGDLVHQMARQFLPA